MKNKLKITLLSVLALLLLFSLELVYSNEYLRVASYDFYTDKTDAGFRIVLISDLHNKQFGKTNKRLINKISKESPDLIAVAGDMVTMWEKERDTATELLKELKKIAPVYCCLGNHERDYSDYDGLIKDIKASGAVLLDNEYTELNVGNDSILIGGLTDFPYYEFEAPRYQNENREFLDSFIEKEKDSFSILLTHQPEFYMWGLKDMNIDLMLCGHTHGGIIRLPFLGGLAAPNQGIFSGDGSILPKYDRGMYSSGSADMIVTSGLGSSTVIPRLNNPPEICVVNINKQAKNI